MTHETQTQEMAARVTLRAEMASRVATRARIAARVATRAQIRDAAHLACRSLPKTASMSDPLERILVAVGEGALLREDGTVHLAGLGNLLRKFKQVVSAVTRFPKLWEHVKSFLGVESIDQLPGRLKDLAHQGFESLKKAFHYIFQTLPMKLFTLPESKLFSVNSILEKLMKASPAFGKFLNTHVKPRVDQIDKWLKEYLPNISKIAMVGVYIFIWINVAEFEWDFKALLEAISGQLSLFDLLSSLPGSALGFLINTTLGSGTFTFLPAALVARLVFVIGKRYVEWTGSGFKFDWEKLQTDFHIEPAILAAVESSHV